MKWNFGVLVLASLAVSVARGELRVVALNPVLGDLARSVGGDRVAVRDLLDPGEDPHLFEPAPGDIREVADADLVLANGLGYEGYLLRLREASGGTAQFFVAGDWIEPINAAGDCVDDADHEHGHHHNHGNSALPDPHWWHSPENAKRVVGAMRDRLSELDPAGREAYAANARVMLERLETLDGWAKAEVAKLPRRQRLLVTSHNALGYFARDYGFETLPVQGLTTAEQPSSKEVGDLIRVLRERGVTALFTESIENPKVLEEIARETGAKPAGTLYVDGLGEGEAATYEGMIRHNVSTIVKGLQP